MARSKKNKAKQPQQPAKPAATGADAAKKKREDEERARKAAAEEAARRRAEEEDASVDEDAEDAAGEEDGEDDADDEETEPVDGPDAEMEPEDNDESADEEEEEEDAESASDEEEAAADEEEAEEAIAAPGERFALGTPTIRLRIKRQDGPGERSYWQEFEVEDDGNMNVISCLMAIQRDPVTRSGERVAPVVWDQACLEEVCGSCTMVINGVVQQSCSALCRKLTQPIDLEPMRKFPVLRDLIVDRSRMFEALKQVRAWIPIDGTHDLGPGPRIAPGVQEQNYILSTCMTCGCCVDACPQVNERNDFIGAAAIGQALLFNSHPTGALNAAERIEGLMEEGGIHECGLAQNCVKVCPKHIPLTTAIMEMGRQTSVYWLKSLFRR